MLQPTTEIVGSISVNPAEVEYVLEQADFRYPGTEETEQYAGWSQFPAIPKLFDRMVHLSRILKPDEAVAFLLRNVDSGTNVSNPQIIRRARHLYFSFCRDMHTFGLIQRADPLGYVQYQKSLDIRYNVDFLATLLTKFGGDDIGIQSAMRARWKGKTFADDPWEKAKKKRRKRRGDVEFDGPIYWLTNKSRRYAKNISGVWLFGPDHITDFVNEIKGTDSEIGIQQMEMDLF